MGINNFHQFIKKKAPHVYRQIYLNEYAGKRVAIDISGLIYKYKILNKDRWLDSFTYLIFALRRNQIHPIFVYDGNAPKEKDNEKTKRSSHRKLLTDKVSTLRDSLDAYYETGEVKQSLQDTMVKLLKIPPTPLGVPINTSLLEKKYDQMESQIVHFSDEELDSLNKLFDLCGIQYITSPVEAETLCSSMALQGKADAVISNDSDVCAYGVKKFLYEINGLNESAIEIDHDELLKALEMTHPQFLDFCIMCGTDYNDNIPGIGPVNAYRLIKKHGCIENIPDIDVTILNHIRGRELFTPLLEYEDEVLSRKPSSIIEIYNFLRLKSSRIQMNTIEEAFRGPEILFE